MSKSQITAGERRVLAALKHGPVPVDDLTDRHGDAVGVCYLKGLIKYDRSGTRFYAELVEKS